MFTQFDSTDVTTRLRQKAQAKHYDIIADAKRLHDFLTPSLLVTRDPFLIYQVEQITLQDLKSYPPDIFFIFGNNNLDQVSDMADKYRFLADPQSSSRPPKKIIISGLGGHGTIAGPIFGRSEAATMARKFEECIPSIGQHILIEETATNTGANIRLADEMMYKLMENNNINPRHIHLSGDYCGALRQLWSYLGQSENIWWHSISILPPAWEKIQRICYGNEKDTYINFVGCLREMGTLLDYALCTKFVSTAKLPNEPALREAMAVLVKYYNLMTGSHLKHDELADQFINLRQDKALGCTIDMNLETVKQIQAMAKYFRLMFSMIEQQHMRKLPELSVQAQSDMMDHRDGQISGPRERYHLM